MSMRALILSVVLIAGPALAQEAPVVTAPQPASQPAAQPVPAPADPLQTPPAPAPGQQVPAAIDPLGDLITQTGTTDEEEAAPTAPAPYHKPTILPIPAPEAPAPAYPPSGEHAVPQGGYVPAEQAYELRVKGSIVAAQGLQGPLDGGWKVAGPDGATLYALQIVDPAGGYGPLEGAWRDVRRPGAVGSTGLIDSVVRDGSDLVVRFSAKPGQSTMLTLHPTGETRWAGDLVEAGAARTVIAEREAPPSLPPGYVIQSRGPVIWGAPRAAAPSRSAPAPVACSTKGKKGKALKAAKAKCAAVAKKGGAKGKATASKGKGGKAKATPARKGKATASKGKSSAKKAPAKKKPNLR
jgi:hypothetical protein